MFTLVVIFGALMYLVEGPEHGFTSIPRGLYWAIVTLTMVGYGDISPQTKAGQAIAAAIMILGYGIIAEPTGIVSAELVRPRVPAFHWRPCAHPGRIQGAAFVPSCRCAPTAASRRTCRRASTR